MVKLLISNQSLGVQVSLSLFIILYIKIYINNKINTHPHPLLMDGGMGIKNINISNIRI